MKCFSRIIASASGLLMVSFWFPSPMADCRGHLNGLLQFESHKQKGSLEVAKVFSEKMALSRPEAVQLERHFLELCHEQSLAPAFVLALIQVESNFQADVVSQAGAVGLLQVMVPTAQFVQKEVLKDNGVLFTEKSLKDPFLNLRIGILYLAYLRSVFPDSPASHILAAYNMGPARFSQKVREKGARWKETQAYFNRVLVLAEEYQRQVRSEKSELIGISRFLEDLLVLGSDITKGPSHGTSCS